MVAVAAATQVLACLKQVNAICQTNGQNLGNISYPLGGCSLTYATAVITTEVWPKPDTQVDATGIFINSQPLSFFCSGRYKTYNSCISAYDNWNALDNGVKTGPYDVTIGNQTGCS